MNSSLLIALGILLGALLALWILFRLAFPRHSSGSARAIAIVICLVVWGNDIRFAAQGIYTIARTLLDDWSRHVAPTLNQVLIGADAIPYFNLLLFFITLVILVRAISALDQGTSPKWLENFRKTSLVFRANLLVLVIFFLGIYFAVASLCTIPSLAVNQPFSEEERMQINAEIDAANPSGDAFDKQFPAEVTLPPDELGHLRSVLKESGREPILPGCEKASSTGATTTPENTGANPAGAGVRVHASPEATDKEAKALHDHPEIQEGISGLLRTYDDDRCSRRNQYYSMRDSVKRILQSMASNAKNVLSSNLALRLTGRDRANYLYEQKNQISNDSNLLQTVLSTCRRSLSDPPYEYLEDEQQAEDLLARLPTATTTLQMTVPLTPATGVGPCSFIPPIYNQMAGANFAQTAQLGVFSQWFGWLENSDSLALSVLCGMLGVGLVGSVVSSFVRQSQTTPATDVEPTATADTALGRLQRRFQSVWIADPFPVIVRGFTAAVVVYLAVEGGLNIFSTGNSQPNPYVLLFACLVGAVFSEDVWVLARKNLPAAEPGHHGGSASDSKTDRPSNGKDSPQDGERHPGE